jgi:hypothetical protein
MRVHPKPRVSQFRKICLSQANHSSARRKHNQCGILCRWRLTSKYVGSGSGHRLPHIEEIFPGDWYVIETAQWKTGPPAHSGSLGFQTGSFLRNGNEYRFCLFGLI